MEQLLDRLKNAQCSSPTVLDRVISQNIQMTTMTHLNEDLL